MKLKRGKYVEGAYGNGTEVIAVEIEVPDEAATIRSWFFHCPGQSPAWEHYALHLIHLRDLPSVPPADKVSPEMTHELLLGALTPAKNPVAENMETWAFLTPFNACEQFEVDSDEKAIEMTEMVAQAIVDGLLPAEPALSGAREPWHTVIKNTAAHFRGEHG